ncbi:Acyl-CoA N-acyltransferase [Penicillium malachiteum]|nr:Acyl-CoA N-acyltransferase [Penicillium malachiteum]
MVGQTSDSTLELKSNKLPLSLRLPKFDDIPAAVEILANKANSDFDKSICDATPEELDAVAKRWTIVTDPPVYRNFLVFYEDKPVGITGYGWIGPCDENQDSNDSSLAGAAGIIVQPSARGKGIAYEALRLVFEYGFREVGLKEIRVGSHSGNVPMWMLMEQKFGVKTIRTAEVDRFGNDLLWTIPRPEQVL